MPIFLNILEQHSTHPFQLTGAEKQWPTNISGQIYPAEREFVSEVFGEFGLAGSGMKLEYEAIMKAMSIQALQACKRAYQKALENREEEEEKAKQAWDGMCLSFVLWAQFETLAVSQSYRILPLQ